jgi:hypothetical protein
MSGANPVTNARAKCRLGRSAVTFEAAP